ncbi:MAG: hypothetical protein RIQ93_1726 [Verrucomicrobiota bacterium]
MIPRDSPQRGVAPGPIDHARFEPVSKLTPEHFEEVNRPPVAARKGNTNFCRLEKDQVQ